MPNRRKVPSTKRSRRIASEVDASMVGSHVARSSARQGRSSAPGRASHASSAFNPVANGDDAATIHRRANSRGYVEAARHQARRRSVLTIVIAVVVVVALALFAGFMAFRSAVGSEMALRNSNAEESLVSVRSGEPYYALIAAELGAVAQPLEHDGPDVLLLVRVDSQNKSMAVLSIPSSLKVATDTGAKRVAELALQGDAALIKAVSNFAKVDISHYVKLDKAGVSAIVDALDGVEVDIDQVIDDPHAGDMYLPVGTYTLTGNSALTYLRADNLRLGTMDQLQHQVDFATLVLSKVFSGEGNFATRLESIDSYFQTDLKLADLEALQGWLRDIPASGIVRTVLPGYLTEVTGVADTGDSFYVCSASDMSSIIAALENGEVPDVALAGKVEAAPPGGFTVEVQNGTLITGAAGVTREMLESAGFTVTTVGNAEQPVYDETLVIYKDDATGPGRAKAIIDTIGAGRAISASIYYKFDTDILVIVGTDYKPFL